MVSWTPQDPFQYITHAIGSKLNAEVWREVEPNALQQARQIVNVKWSQSGDIGDGNAFKINDWDQRYDNSVNVWLYC